CSLVAPRPLTHWSAGFQIVLRSAEEDVYPPVVQRIERVVSIRQGRKAIPGPGCELVIVECGLEQRESQAILVDELDDEDDLGRPVIVGGEVLSKRGRQLIHAGVDDA